MWASLRMCAEIILINARYMQLPWQAVDDQWKAPIVYNMLFDFLVCQMKNEKWKIGVTYWNSLGLSFADDSIQRNACEVRLRVELKKWSSHLLDNLRDCLILCTLKILLHQHFFHSSFHWWEHMSPINWPGKSTAPALQRSWVWITSRTPEIFSCICETITEIVQQMWGS